MSASLSAAAERLAALVRHHDGRAASARGEGMVYLLEPADYAELVQRADAVTRELPDPNVPPVWGLAYRAGPRWDRRWTAEVTVATTDRTLRHPRRFLIRSRAEARADRMADGLTGLLVRLGVVETGHACQVIRVELQERP